MKTKSLLLVSALGLASLPHGALAGDGAAPHDWSGFRFGVVLDSGGTGLDVKGAGKKDKADLRSGNASLGAFAGYDFLNGPFLFGLEGSIGTQSFDDVRDIAGLGKLKASSDWNADMAFRAGYAFDDVLIFAKAGVAYTNVDLRSSVSGKDDVALVGAIAGIGAEYALGENTSILGEVDLRGFEGKAELPGGDTKFSLGSATARLGFVMHY